MGKLTLVSGATRRQEAGSRPRRTIGVRLRCGVAGQVAEWFKAPVLKTYSGRVAEWSIAAVLKTADVQASVGSNPTPSANKYSYLALFQVRCASTQIARQITANQPAKRSTNSASI